MDPQLISQMSHFNSFKGRIVFEISSWIGRKFCSNRSKIPLTKQPVLLDLGVGDNYVEGWTHADFFSCPRYLNPLKYLYQWKNRSGRLPEVELDLRFPINCPDSVIDGVYSSHTIEHLLPENAINLLREIYRILKPKKYLRIIVPDLEVAVNYYLENRENGNSKTGCEAIIGCTQNWGHISAWDEKLLTSVLKDIGFSNINRVDYGVGGQDTRLMKEGDTRELESLVIEAQK
jgi:SAM-dependent methyltransferase